MSDNIPFDIQVQIMKKLPVKTLIQFRSVSKTWKSLIDSPHFISRYSAQGTQVQHLLVNTDYTDNHSKNKYYLIAEDDTFPKHKLSVPLPDNLVKYYNICGSAYGLVCLYGDFQKARRGHVGGTSMAVLWNPSIRKAVAVVVPHEGFEIYITRLSLCVCRETMDPKIVKIRYIRNWENIKSIACIPWQVEVFTLSTGAWRRSYSNLPRKSIQFNLYSKVVEVDGFLYWLASDRITMKGGFRSYNLILSFDMTSEEFAEVKIPDILAYGEYDTSTMFTFKLRESLAIVLQEGEFMDDQVFTVWKMEDGFPKSFTKLYTLNASDAFQLHAYIRGFRKGGEPVFEVEDLEDYGEHVQLAVYDPRSKKIRNVGFNGTGCAYLLYPYIETLLLLDQPDFVVYNDI